MQQSFCSPVCNLMVKAQRAFFCSSHFYSFRAAPITNGKTITVGNAPVTHRNQWPTFGIDANAYQNMTVRNAHAKARTSHAIHGCLFIGLSELPEEREHQDRRHQGAGDDDAHAFEGREPVPDRPSEAAHYSQTFVAVARVKLLEHHSSPSVSSSRSSSTARGP